MTTRVKNHNNATTTMPRLTTTIARATKLNNDNKVEKKHNKDNQD